MIKLIKNAFEKAKNYLFKKGRKLDQALFKFHFEVGVFKEVVTELRNFQNSDGGFGHGLEADLRSPHSSVIATSHALEILAQHEDSANLEITQKAITYMLDQFDHNKEVWEMIPKEVTDTPHPWWWTYDKLEENFGGFLINPRARVVGNLWSQNHLVPAGFLDEITSSLLKYIEILPDELGMYDLLSCAILLESNHLPEEFSQRLLSRMIKSLPLSMVKTIDQIEAHQITPLFLIDSPDSRLAPAIPEGLLNANLDWLIDTQLSDGSWNLGWTWHEVDADLWVQAEKDWKGSHIVKNLRTLSAFDRI
ncbi:MAG: hypothetical protein HON98_09515 [Chloroflexi bacterium]|jgi:hypothetical protein|nr:hypothetical protein [Chloroflexota bacterium]MBT3671006.1 hypothetical protein [Chloroflexota bacterium]MBT4002328.1 hypothetical protein [Chloroflexota bacterium]MBT4305039.1 hypothetical protein [Chloroflexota bacterium]MBT4533850.1 hypothetical protein [Chloroflexota bacterium]